MKSTPTTNGAQFSSNSKSMAAASRTVSFASFMPFGTSKFKNPCGNSL